MGISPASRAFGGEIPSLPSQGTDPFQSPERWIPIHTIAPRIQNVHRKEFSKEGTDYSLAGPESWPASRPPIPAPPLLDGTVDWPAVMEAFEKAGYKGWLTVEHVEPWRYYSEALIRQASDALDRILGRG